MKDQGLLYQDPDTRKYQLGPLVAEIASAMNRSFDTHLISLAQPFLDKLSADTGEGVAIEVLAGDSSVLAYQIPARTTLRVTANVGDRLPVHVSSGAKIILAFSDPQRVDKILDRKLVRYTANTITDPEVLKKHLIEYRRQGVAFDYGELDEDVYTVAAPILNYEQKPVAAVLIAGPDKRMGTNLKESEMIKSVKEAALSISKRLFYQENPK
jgi:DNA-binding IclR family transcriptional regulator